MNKYISGREIFKREMEEKKEFKFEVSTKLKSAGIDLCKCDYCGEYIIFVRSTRNRKKHIQLSMNLKNHYSECEFRKKMRIF
jgi:hypothetical protein